MPDRQPIYSYAPVATNSWTTGHRPRRSLLTFIVFLALASFCYVILLSTDGLASLRRNGTVPITSQDAMAPHDSSASDRPSPPTPFRPEPEQEAKAMMSDAAAESLNAFLTASKVFAMQRLAETPASSPDSAENKPVPITLIMGNEAGDLDSSASAISLSYLLTRFGPPASTQLPASIYLPLIQSNHDDAVLRPENTAAYHAASIDPDQLLCLDDLRDRLGLSLDSDAFSPEHGVALGLVDHPSLTGPWGGAGATNRHVSIVIDHHEDVDDHPDAPLRIVDSPSRNPVGSASSLVANLFRERLTESDDAVRQVADLLISAIVVDTDNLRPVPRGKATDTDFNAIKLLLPLSSFSQASQAQQIQQTALRHSPLNASSASTTSDASSEVPLSPLTPGAGTDPAIDAAKAALRPYWSILFQSKMQVAHLGGRDLLRRDYKELEFREPASAGAAAEGVALRLGFASVPLSLAEWLHKDRPTPSLRDAVDATLEVEEAWRAWWRTLDAFMDERRIDLAVMTGSFRAGEGEAEAGKHKRELVLAFAPRQLSPSTASTIWETLRQDLESDAHVPADHADRRLMLERPWKGQRLPENAGGKRERVQGIASDGRRTESEALRYAMVYRQANARANRKVVLPAVVSVLRGAVAQALGARGGV